jgi:hypothetical protein
VSDTIDITSDAFAIRLASSLRTSREAAGTSLRALARASAGTFTVRQLRALEEGSADLAGNDLLALAGLYRIDLGSLLLPRVPIEVDLATGVLRIAGLHRSFVPADRDGLLIAYLEVVRALRGQPNEPAIALRRDDIDVLARALDAEPSRVVHRLGALMGATAAQRRSMVLALLAGATTIVLATGALAAEPVPSTASSADAGGTTAIAVPAESAD